MVFKQTPNPFDQREIAFDFSRAIFFERVPKKTCITNSNNCDLGGVWTASLKADVAERLKASGERRVYRRAEIKIALERAGEIALKAGEEPKGPGRLATLEFASFLKQDQISGAESIYAAAVQSFVVQEGKDYTWLETGPTKAVLTFNDAYLGGEGAGNTTLATRGYSNMAARAVMAKSSNDLAKMRIAANYTNNITKSALP